MQLVLQPACVCFIPCPGLLPPADRAHPREQNVPVPAGRISPHRASLATETLQFGLRLDGEEDEGCAMELCSSVLRDGHNRTSPVTRGWHDAQDRLYGSLTSCIWWISSLGWFPSAELCAVPALWCDTAALRHLLGCVFCKVGKTREMMDGVQREPSFSSEEQA